ncbi:hexosaminidase D-like isoform X2 [Phymastichus coffea]|uniref:hexosaminidase D-like isoform X2 n=1 Tax=Phymastichus coffea TaxID=108790 RepID=UPI00273C0BF9|nr:hexosaminidase D-like isoform X2 [Phymastichus coffea]
MSRLKGRTSMTIILLIIFALLIIVYHLLSSEVDDVSRKEKLRAQSGDNQDMNEEIDSIDKNNVDKSSYRSESFYKGHKMVHLDLKGAPPVINYYRYLFPVIKKLGATGILIEYEDMFPFKDDLADASAENCYSESEISVIQEIAKENNLIVIPLIQTFGHLEFLLKLKKYIDYREVYRYPQVVCPTYNKTQSLLFTMIDQVITLHPHIQYLHIGADEVYQLGECIRCAEKMSMNQWNKKQLFLNHVHAVASYIKKKYPRLVVLMWDDEYRDIEPQEIISRGLNKLVQPVVWKYTTDPMSVLTDQLWENYAQVWKSVWVATAFKGATAPDRYYTDISYHVENHQRWLEIIVRQSKRIKFQGVMLTGWQRYDHFSVLCELIPSALPSLAVNLMVLQSSDYNTFPVEVPRQIMDILNCDGLITLSLPEPQYGWTKCNYFGSSIYSATLRLHSLCQDIARMEQDSTFKGWLKPYNIKYVFSNPSHVERAVVELDRYKMEINYIEKEMKSAMEGIYNNYTIQEWLETYVYPLNDKINALWDAKEKILDRESWPRRPLVKPSDT